MTTTGGPPPDGRRRVVQLMRRTFPGHYSMERVFAQVRPELASQGWPVEVVVTSHFNRGVLPRLRTTWEAARLDARVLHITGDITFAATLRRRAGLVVTVHDTEFLDRASPAKCVLYRFLWLRLPVWRAAVVTVPTEATRRDLMAEVRVEPEKVRVVPNPVAPGLHSTAPLRPLPPIPVVLIVGTRPNKNVVGMLDALAGLECRVVLVGRLDAEQQLAAARSGLPVEVRVDVDDAALRASYEECDVVLFASKKEGFGIPVLEGQAMGRPVVTSNRAPMPEVAGPGGAELVDPDSPASIRAGVERVLADPAYREDLVRRGRANVAAYTPAAVAAAYAAVYAEVASRS